MHRISIVGKLTGNPILNCNGKLSATFTVEITDNIAKKSIFYDVIAFGTNARFISTHASAGTQIMVVGKPLIANDKGGITGARITVDAVLIRIIDSKDLWRESDAIHKSYCNMAGA